jgi:hypothetical protein
MPGVTIDNLRQLLPTHEIARYDNSSQTATMRDGRQLAVWVYRQQTSARTCVAALNRLNGDSAVPALWGADVAGQLCGTAFVLADAPRGQLLAHVDALMSHDQRYAVGQQLGQIVARWQLQTYAGFGTLNDATHPMATVLQQRIDTAISTLREARTASADTLTALIPTLVALYHTTSTQAVLVCGDIAPETVWVERHGARWQVTHVTSWSSAHAGLARAEHVRLQHHFDGEQWFALRVGYGEAYDEQTPNAGMQMREHALHGERVVYTLQLAAAAARRSDSDTAHALLTRVQRWCATFSPETTFSTTEENA